MNNKYIVNNGSIIIARRNGKTVTYLRGISFSVTRSNTNPNKKGIAGSIIMSSDDYKYLKNGKEEVDTFDVQLINIGNGKTMIMDILGLDFLMKDNKLINKGTIVTEYQQTYIAKNITEWKEYKEK